MMNASIGPILERKWVRLTLMAAIGLALALALSVASSKSASAQALCFDPNTGTTFVCSEEQAALEAALQAAALGQALQDVQAAQTIPDATTIPGSTFGTPSAFPGSGTTTIPGENFLTNPALMDPAIAAAANPTALGGSGFPVNLQTGQPAGGAFLTPQEAASLLDPFFTR